MPTQIGENLAKRKLQAGELVLCMGVNQLRTPNIAMIAAAFGSGPQLGYAAIPQAEVCKIINRETLLMAMIETPEAVANADSIAAVDGIDTLHIGASDLSTEMGIPGQYAHDRMKAAFETVAKAARSHGKSFGVGGVRQDFQFQSWLISIGMRYLTGGSDVGYILSAGRADVKQLRELKV